MFTTTNLIKALMALGATVSAFLLMQNFIILFFSKDGESSHKKRLNQLKFNQKRTSSDDSTREFINKFTNPVAKHVVPRLNLDVDSSQLQKDLIMAQWENVFTPETFIAMEYSLKIIGIVLLIVFFPMNKIFGIILFSVFFFGFKFLFKNSISNRKFQLLNEFPEFIKVTEGFLTSNLPLPQAIESALPYIGEAWKPLLREFVMNSEMYSQEECIDILSNQVDIFEVRELLSLIRLNTEQGIDIKECFSNQADKVRQLQLAIIEEKIGKREMMSIAIQAPLLLCIIVGFGLPTLYQMVTLSM